MFCSHIFYFTNIHTFKSDRIISGYFIIKKRSQMNQNPSKYLKDSSYCAQQYQGVIKVTSNLFASRLTIQQEYSHKLKDLVQRQQTSQFAFVEKEADYIFNKIVRLFNQQSDSANRYAQSLKSLHQIQCFTENKLAEIETLNHNITREVESIRQSIKNHDFSYQELNRLQCDYLVKCFTQSTMVEINNKQVKVQAFDKKAHKPNCETYKHKHQKIEKQIEEFERTHAQMNEVLDGIENSFFGMTVKLIQSIKQLKEKQYQQMINGLAAASSETDEESKKKRKQNYFEINFKTLHKIKVPEHRNRGYIKAVYDYCRDQITFKQFVAFGIKHDQSQASFVSSHSSLFFQQIETDIHGEIDQIISFFEDFFIKPNPIENPYKRVQNISKIFAHSKKYRKILCQCFECLRRKEKPTISSENIEGIKVILNNFLYQCMEKGDIWNSMKLVSSSVRFLVQFPNKQIRLHRYIYEHPIFYDEQWWFGCILLNCLIDIKIQQNGMRKKIEVVQLENNSFNNAQTKIIGSMSSIKILNNKGIKSSEFFRSIIKHLVSQIEIMKITGIRRETTQGVVQKVRKMFDPKITKEMDAVFQELYRGEGLNENLLMLIEASFQ